MKAQRRVSVVILNWNGKALLETFIPALVRYTPAWVELVVGDNASTDDSVAFLQANYPSVKIIINEVNLGYAGGYNLVLERVEADYFVLLNSDVEVTAGWIEPLLRYMESHPATAVCQPKVRSHSDRTRFEYAGASGGYMDRFGYFFCRGRIFDSLETDDGQYDDEREVFWASGAAFFVKVEAFRRAGGFDALLFAHMEEIDLCWRFWRMGYRVAVVPSSVIYHIGGGTLNKLSPRKTFLNFRNNLILLYRNLPLRKRAVLIPFRFVLDFLACVRFLLLGDLPHALAINRAHYAFLTGLPEWKKARRLYDLECKPPGETPGGVYRGSVVADYFVYGLKKFSQLGSKSGKIS